jgi:hypothetical protein
MGKSSMNRAIPGFVAIAGLILVMVGCSGAVGPKVKGQVLLDGKAVEGARIVFEGKGGSTAITDSEGRFYLDGTTFKSVQPGAFVVRISKYVDKKTGKPPAEEDYDQMIASGAFKNALPNKYAAAEENPLSVEIKEGINELKPFELKSK